MAKRLFGVVLVVTLSIFALGTMSCATQAKANEKSYQTEKPKNKSGRQKGTPASSDDSSAGENGPEPPPPPTY